jgi:flagellin-like protein
MSTKHAVWNRERRAVSEVVATLLLVAIVVSMGVIVFTFSSGSLSSLTGNFSGLMTNQGDAVAEHFVVEQVAFTFTGTTGADVYVRNIGTIASTIVSVFIVDASTGTLVTQVPLTTGQGTLDVGTVLDISHTILTFTPSHGNTYSFTVTSSLGNSVTFYSEAA